ncbi:iron chelate uptake ABC transporter family permease subunit [Amycolatopsis carbonis]|uniref:Iron chelate uptake ABC transporter family permease subunit n=1 Tax=Amycolatopsis carbonis TaxID=715471 RepID=A0A9Y2INV9_9PSEU|nr:iron chelate uptake ABC transporter family permease subunit [Amycolatopsis sp. 2-15]WIX82446.1 iron chelate uptake ABC transporter family permease subunit [Amycolatopsis sp. 2-15]
MKPPQALPDALKAVSAARRRGAARVWLVSIVVFVLLVSVFALSLAVGDFNVPLGQLPGILFGDGTGAGAYVVTELRLPRAVAAVLVGVAFGLGGALFQRLLRNPLASPDVIGVTQGASAAAVICLVLFGVSGPVLSAAAFVGALLTGVIIYVLSRRGGVNGYRLVLIGVGVGAVLASIVSYLMTWADVTLAQQALVWLTGNLNGASWDKVVPLAIALVVLGPAALLLSRALTGLQLGDDTAAGLGLRVERMRLLLLLVATALAAFATAAAGPVSFVAFVANPVATRLVGGARVGLVAPALTGALVTLLGDFVAQHLLGTQLPVGVVTGAVGAPYLLYLLATANRAGRV